MSLAKGNIENHQIRRLPRKIKKQLKRMYKSRYGIDWLDCDNLIIEYYWFFKNPFKWDMNKKLFK